MPSTVNRAFRYPAPTDVPDGPLAIKNLAEDLDAALYDTGWLALPLAAGSGTAFYRRVGLQVAIKCNVTASYGTGFTYIVNAGGIPSGVRPASEQPGTAYFAGYYPGGIMALPNGAIYAFQQTGASRASIIGATAYLLG